MSYALPLTEALAAAHKRGIVHRDLKPGNVMLSEEGRIKLLDFGLATIAAGTEAFAPLDRVGPLTSEGLVVGTHRYMSPEQLQGRPLDCRSDVFALGVVLYEMAVDRTPFRGATPAETWAAILRERPAPVSALRPDLPREVSDLIMRCLEKDPHRRFADASEILRELAAPTQAGRCLRRPRRGSPAAAGELRPTCCAWRGRKTSPPTPPITAPFWRRSCRP